MGNPFTPTFGIVPPVLAGRGKILSDMDRAFDNWPGDPNLCTILIGPRGSGKTAMLSCIGDIALQKGWIVADTSASEGMLEDILQRTLDVTSEYMENKSGKHLTGVDIGNLLGLRWTLDTAGEANWRSRMSELLKRLKEKDIGLLITIDEVRANIEAMIMFAQIYQLLIREGAKLALVMAGLPIHVSELLADDGASFLRRARQQYMGRIPDRDIRNAFRQTVETEGKAIGSEALETAVSASNGFAYMMQLVGYEMWSASGTRETISGSDAVEGVKQAKADFRTGVLNSTYRELSDGDINFLKAMLADEECSSISDIAERMGKSAGYVATYKKRLLQAGVIEEAQRAKVTFAIPMFREFLDEQFVQ